MSKLIESSNSSDCPQVEALAARARNYSQLTTDSARRRQTELAAFDARALKIAEARRELAELERQLTIEECEARSVRLDEFSKENAIAELLREDIGLHDRRVAELAALAELAKGGAR